MRGSANRLSWLLGIGKLVAITLIVAPACWAQITGVNDQTATPTAGIGHDYLHMLNETVNPANGSVSVRIQVPVPAGRSLALPFSFAYDSGGFWAPGADPNGIPYFGYSNNVTLEGQNNGGWAYSLPTLSFTAVYTGGGSQTPVDQLCPENTGFTFQSPSGGRLSPAGHSIAAGERATQLEKLINTGTLSAKDTSLARAIVQDLRNALIGK